MSDMIGHLAQYFSISEICIPVFPLFSIGKKNPQNRPETMDIVKHNFKNEPQNFNTNFMKTSLCFIFFSLLKKCSHNALISSHNTKQHK